MKKILIGKWQQRGDTIVEVMVAMLVIGTILAGAYSLTRSSTIAGRQAQEHTEALGLLEAQIEDLRADANDVLTNPSSAAGNYFCMYIDSSNNINVEGLTSLVPTDFSTYPAATNCNINSVDQNAATVAATPGAEPAFYYVSIYACLGSSNPAFPQSSHPACPQSGPVPITYILQANWNSASGNGEDSVQLSYRLQ